MANYLGNRLSRLIRERAYLSGSLPELQEDVRQAQTSLDAKVHRLNLAQQRLLDVDQQLRELSSIDPSKIAAIRRTTRHGHKEHGAIRRMIFDLLKLGQPIRTTDLIRHMAPLFDWDLSTPKGRIYAIDAVREPLRRFKNKGLVERLPDGVSDNGQRIGVWRWIGPSESENPPAKKKTADL